MLEKSKTDHFKKNIFFIGSSNLSLFQSLLTSTSDDYPK